MKKREMNSTDKVLKIEYTEKDVQELKKTENGEE